MLTAQRQIALALGGEAGARLSKILGMPISGDTLLRRLASIERPSPGPLKIIGVDDWALRRGQTYGTLICDLERKRPIAVLPSRSAETLTAWLKEHPEIEVISRDRAGEYAKAASEGAPQATQVADRWHLLRNVQNALQKVIEPRQPVINGVLNSIEPESTDGGNHEIDPAICPVAAAEPKCSSSTSDKEIARRARYEKVIELASQGHSQRSIARLTGLNRKTVEKFMIADEYPMRSQNARKTRISKYAREIETLLHQGTETVSEIHRNLRLLGFDGSYYSVRRYLRRMNCSPKSIDVPKSRFCHELWSVRRTAWLMTTQPMDLSGEDATRIKAINEACPDIKVASDLARDFIRMIRKRERETWDEWIAAAVAVDTPKPIRLFAKNLLHDQDAVKAALRLPWSNGQLEGQINRLKTIKRQMYGRANLKLLECRVLSAA